MLRLHYIGTFLLLWAISVGCGSSSTLQEETAPSATVYFSATEGAFEGGTDERIVADIMQAQYHIALAMYDLTNEKIANALMDAKERGVEVEVMTDDTKVSDTLYAEMASANIPIYHDNDPNALMHDKFLVIDDTIVWMGSANFTYYAFYRNNENSIRWVGSSLASDYMEEFNERKAHTLVDHVYRHPNMLLYFSPEDHFRDKLLSLIADAKSEIVFMIYTFTDAQIADALIEAAKRGVAVRGIFDEGQDAYQSYSKYSLLQESGLDVKLDGNPYKLHHKVMVIDANTTVVGSYNFTDAAESKNSEEAMVLYDLSISKQFHEMFEALFAIAK